MGEQGGHPWVPGLKGGGGGRLFGRMYAPKLPVFFVR